MKRSTKATAPMGKDAARIITQQALSWAAHSLSALRKEWRAMYERDEAPEGSEHADMTVGLVLSEVQRMARDGEDLLDCATPWYRCLSALRLALASLAEPEATAYGRLLRGVVDGFDTMPDLWQHVEMQGVRQCMAA